eukprot:788581-Amphidinium_carterae.2
MPAGLTMPPLPAEQCAKYLISASRAWIFPEKPTTVATNRRIRRLTSTCQPSTTTVTNGIELGGGEPGVDPNTV